MNRVLQLALVLFVALLAAGAVNAALIAAAPDRLRAPWVVVATTGGILLVAVLAWWKATVRRQR